MKLILRLGAAVLSLAALAACSSHPSSVQMRIPAAPAPTAIHVPPRPLVGVYEPGVPGYAQISQFTHATGVQPQVVLYYSGWGESFQSGFATAARQHGAYTFVQLQPNGTTLARVAAGYSDPYLKRYAGQVRAFGYPVLLSFAHEMNGGWYSWGTGHATPAQFVSAWRHVVQVFRSQGASNVTWVWTVNAVNAGSASLRQWWPGSQWVNFAGIDGYFYFSSDTFASVFGRTLADIRAFTSAPVFIGETAVGPGPEAVSQVTGLLAGVKADHFAGLVWFDKAQHDPPYHQNWHLADDPAALAAFQAGVRGAAVSHPFTQEEFDRIYAKVVRLTVEVVLRDLRGVFLTRRSAGPCRGLWHIPGGTVRFAEPLADAVARVAFAETGVTVTESQFLGPIEYPSHYLNGLGCPVGIAFAAEWEGEPEALGGCEGGWFDDLPPRMHDEQAEFLALLNRLDEAA